MATFTASDFPFLADLDLMEGDRYTFTLAPEPGDLFDASGFANWRMVFGPRRRGDVVAALTLAGELDATAVTFLLPSAQCTPKLDEWEYDLKADDPNGDNEPRTFGTGRVNIRRSVGA